MRNSRRILVLSVVLIIIQLASTWFIWNRLIKFSWCQKPNNLGYRQERKVVISFDGAGIEKTEAEQARSIIRGVVDDPRGWRQAGFTFVFNNQPADVIFHITTSDKLDILPQCSRQYSCRVGRDIYINNDRWHNGSTALSISKTEYRVMIINHELGHLLGFDHWQCYGHGAKAPVMQQQSLGLGGLVPNSWPTEVEIKSLLKSNFR